MQPVNESFLISGEPAVPAATLSKCKTIQAADSFKGSPFQM
jgi:hypothetical protein